MMGGADNTKSQHILEARKTPLECVLIIFGIFFPPAPEKCFTAF
jgi:hypothetical protein